MPYNVPTVLSDKGGPWYEETWRYGAFEEQIRAADGPKVFVNVEHEHGIRGMPDSESHNGFAKLGQSSMKGAPATPQRSSRAACPR